MNIILALSTVSLAFQAAAALAAFAIARAPGWGRVRIVGWLAFTAGLYSFNDCIGALYSSSAVSLAAVTSANLAVGAAHVAIWTWFSFSDVAGRWSSVPRSLRLLASIHVGATAMLALVGGAVDSTQLDSVRVASLNVAFVQAPLTPLATLSAGVSLAMLCLNLAEQARQARRGVAGAWLIVAGFVVFIATAVEEVAVAAGALDFIYLVEVGYLALVIPVIVQFIRLFNQAAHRLQALTESLGDEVARKTAERDAAREALAAEARFTALGRMAGGVAHEINNPLQVLTVRLEELHESLSPGASDAREAVENSIAATQRIERIVEGMRAYARPPAAPPVKVAPAEIVRAAADGFRSQLPKDADLILLFAAAPAILIDRERVTGAVVHAIMNASVALAASRPRDGRIEVVTRTGPAGDAIIEVRDNGAGFPAELLPRLGEPFLTTRPTHRSAGLGLFVMRGVTDAQGGLLELENGANGGAVVRFRFPAAAR